MAVGPHLSSICVCLGQKNFSYSLGHAMPKSKLQDLLQSSCRLDLVFLSSPAYVSYMVQCFYIIKDKRVSSVRCSKCSLCSAQGMRNRRALSLLLRLDLRLERSFA